MGRMFMPGVFKMYHLCWWHTGYHCLVSTGQCCIFIASTVAGYIKMQSFLMEVNF